MTDSKFSIFIEFNESLITSDLEYIKRFLKSSAQHISPRGVTKNQAALLDKLLLRPVIDGKTLEMTASFPADSRDCAYFNEFLKGITRYFFVQRVFPHGGRRVLNCKKAMGGEKSYIDFVLKRDTPAVHNPRNSQVADHQQVATQQNNAEITNYANHLEAIIGAAFEIMTPEQREKLKSSNTVRGLNIFEDDQNQAELLEVPRPM